ncbi:hypothetical protein BU17DRAFT_89348 [Hysterangium stoloniferum]|nr:hypothetical protein BU17DRAFT_89348 [Hysterangium stoloniferum]
MTTFGLPYFFEDTTGLATGPSDFLDIYDRPPYLYLSSSHAYPGPNAKQRVPVDAAREGRTLKIFELGTRALTSSRRPHREDGTPPSAVISLDAGTVKLFGDKTLALERWLRKSSTFGSTLVRQFRGSDGMTYQWSFRTANAHEWACVQLETNCLVAHYDIRSPSEPVYKTSGNVLTVYEHCVHISVELLASLILMRNLQAPSKR